VSFWNPTAAEPPSEDVVDVANRYSPRHVLDVGCGTGRNLVPFDRPGTQLVGVDRDPEAVDAATSRFARSSADSVQMHCVDLRTFVPDHEFDLVLCYGVLHFLSRDDRGNAYQRFRSWVTEEGLVSVVMFNSLVPIPEDLRDLMPDPATDSSELLEAFADFRIINYSSYVYCDEHENGIRHTHSIDRLLAQRV